jgi:chemotaxis methyl-accepting protein methylase
LLEEEGLGRGCTVHVTDPDESALESARGGKLEANASLQPVELNYREAGGRRRLASHFGTGADQLALNPSLLEGVEFSVHDPAIEAPFGEFQAISCRYGLSQVDDTMQASILASLHGGLCMFGHLGLGNGETLAASPHARDYRMLSATEPLYQRVR